MSIFELVILMCAMTGVIMVIVSLFFVYKGILKIQEASGGDSLSIELMNQIKMSTRYPALGFFIFGFAFVFIAILFSQNNQEWSISGRFLTDQRTLPNAARLLIEPNCEPSQSAPVDTNGKFSKKFSSNHKGDFTATMNAAGYIPTTITLTKGFLGSLTFDNQNAYNLQKHPQDFKFKADEDVSDAGRKNTSIANNNLKTAHSYSMTTTGGL